MQNIIFSYTSITVYYNEFVNTQLKDVNKIEACDSSVLYHSIVHENIFHYWFLFF